MALLDEPTAIYRYGSASLSTDRPEAIAGRLRTLERMLTWPELSDEERRSVAWRLGHQRSQHALAGAEASLLRGLRSSRLWAGVALGSKTPVRTRLKAAAAFAAPRVVRSRLRDATQRPHDRRVRYIPRAE